MRLSQAGHVAEDDLELYAMEGLPETALADVEEHLLVCHQCQDQLEATGTYMTAMRGAARRVSCSPPKIGRPAWWRPALAMAAVAALVAGLGLWRQPRAGAPMAVMLQAIRGPIPAQAQVPARRPLSLNLDLTDLAAFPSYQVEVVNETGRPLWRGIATPDNGWAAAIIPPLLSKGRYYIRLYSPSADLLREYGLELN